MQIANILSDLTSLRVCDYSAALALVSARDPSDPKSAEASSIHAHPKLVSRESAAEDEDEDMQRATDLVDLHYGVKVKHAQGLDKELLEARKEVERVVEGLRREGR